MFRKLTITALIATAGLSAVAPSADAAPKNRCKLPGTTTLAMSGQGRVFDQNGTVTACLKKTGQRIVLEGATPGEAVATAGKFAAFGTGSVVNVQRITDGAIPSELPHDTGGEIGKIVVKPNGAAAWAVTPLDDPEASYVQGNERSNHTPQLFSDSELGGVDVTSLTSVPGTGITWLHADGTTGSANLFAGPAELA